MKICDPFPKRKWIRLVYFLGLYQITSPDLYSLLSSHFPLPLSSALLAELKKQRDKTRREKLPCPSPDFSPGGQGPWAPAEVPQGRGRGTQAGGYRSASPLPLGHLGTDPGALRGAGSSRRQGEVTFSQGGTGLVRTPGLD